MPSHRYLLKIAALVLGLSGGVTSQTVTVANGTIQGVKCPDTNVNSFLGIPYAKPPTGNLRFAAPKPYDSKYSGGTLQAIKPAPNCPQFGSFFLEQGASSEDCLFLDVYVPSTATPSSSLPVKVWLYGGSNEAGGISNPTYNGCFAATDTILVSVNYRLGPLGWLAVPALGIGGNFGILDQLLALAWVQHNIAPFGGDPRRVLLFGQSAGAADAFVLATLPQAPSLISAVALESGGGRSLATAQQVTSWNRRFIQQLGCVNIACLRSASLHDLNNTALHFNGSDGTASIPGAETLLMNASKGPTWAPVIDGTVIPTAPLTAGLRVPAIAGSTTREGTLFVLGTYLSRAFTLNATDYDAFLSTNFGPEIAADIKTAYPLSLFNTTSQSQSQSPLPPAYNAIASVITSSAYHCPARRALRTGLRNGITDMFSYSFNHTPSCAWYHSLPTDRTALETLLGATHTAEIPFVFNLTRGMPAPGGNCSFLAEEEKMAGFMVQAWDRMAAEGRPGGESEDSWPAWTEGEAKGVVVGDGGVSVGVVDYGECEFWDGIDEKVARLAGGGDDGGNAGGSGDSGNAGGRVDVGLGMLGVTAVAAVVVLA